MKKQMGVYITNLSLTISTKERYTFSTSDNIFI